MSVHRNHFEQGNVLVNFGFSAIRQPTIDLYTSAELDQDLETRWTQKRQKQKRSDDVGGKRLTLRLILRLQ